MSEEAINVLGSDIRWEPKTNPVGNGTNKISRSEEQKNLFAALVKAQSTMTGAKKDSENPHFKSKYADLAAVWDAMRGPLTSNGLCLIQEPQPCDSGILLESTLGHISGEWRSSVFYIPIDAGRMSNAHAYGSTLTYARRYAGIALVGIAPEDDDGNASVSSKAPRVDEKLMKHMKAVKENIPSILQIQESLATNDYETAAQAMHELDRDTQIALWSVAPTKGGVFTTKERDQMKSDEWSAAMGLFHESNGEPVANGES
jgi:hypothetical protein